MHRTFASTILVTLIIIATSCGGSPPPTGESAVPTRKPVPVRTLVLEMSQVPIRFEAPGTVRASVSTVVSSRVSGRIESLPIHEGDRVRKDQLIAEIDSRDASARVRGAEAGLAEARQAQEELERSIRAAEAAVKVATSNRDLAQSTLNRYTVLRDRKSVSPQEYDEVQARLNSAAAARDQAAESLGAAQAKRSQLLARIQQAEANLDAANIALSDYRIVSPIDGIVTEKRAEAGMMASPGMQFAAIEDNSRYELEVAIEEARVSGLRIGQTADVVIGALERTLTGSVVRILPLGDPASRTYTVRVALPRIAGTVSMRSGFFGRAIFSAGEQAALLIPRSSLVDRGELTGVYVVNNDVAVFRIVRLGSSRDSHIELLSGVKPGERIVMSPDAALSDGAPVVESTP